MAKGLAYAPSVTPRLLGKGTPLTPSRKPRVIRQKRRSRFAFTPFKAPARPPAGSYDPALDSAERAANRGLLDLRQDVGTANTRSLSDLILSQQNVQRQQSEGLADLMRRRQGVQRSYQQLGVRQAEGQANAGVFAGGALLEAVRKRAANQALDTQPIDIADTRLRQETGRRLGALGQDYTRSYQDRNLVKLPRAARENIFFGQDTAAQRFYQAKVNDPTSITAPPKNEFNRFGLTYRVAGAGKKRTYTTSGGRRFNRSQWLNMVRKRRNG